MIELIPGWRFILQQILIEILDLISLQQCTEKCNLLLKQNSNIRLRPQPQLAGLYCSSDQSTFAGYSEGYGTGSSVYEQISAKDNKIIELSEEVVGLKRQVWDLEEGLKEKDEIISARTAAVGLASASIAAKGLDLYNQQLSH